MLFASFTPDVVLHTLLGNSNLPARRLLGFLLEAVNKDDLSTGEKEIQKAVDIPVTSAPQLPDFPFKVFDQRLTGVNVALPELVDGPIKTGAGFPVKGFQKLKHRAVALGVNIKLNRPRLFIWHYTDFSILEHGCQQGL